MGVRVTAISPSESGNYCAGHTGVIIKLNGGTRTTAVVHWDHSREEHTSQCDKLITNGMQGKGKGKGKGKGNPHKPPGPECPETGRKNGGVLLVCEHPQHGPCLVVFHNRHRDCWVSPA